MTKPVLRLPANTRGRDFVVGDIHGTFYVLEQALAAVGFDPARDRVICVGDLIDRGQDSHRVLEYLAKPWFHSIRGNHEEMMLYAMREGKLDRDIITRNIPNGMGWLLDETPERLIRMALAFLDLPLAIEIAGADGKPESRTGFVHADVPAGLDWDRFTALLEAGHPKAIQAAQWSRRRVDARDASGVAGIARVFLGHTPQSQPVQLGNCFFIDTGGVFRMVNAPYSDHLFLTLADIKAPAGKITAHPNARVDFMAVAARRKPAPKKPGPKKPRPKPPAGPS